MGSRSPASPDWTYAYEDISPGEDIIETVPDVILDNQEWILDREAPLICEVWYPIEITSTSYVTVMELFAIGADRCGTDASYAATSYILAWASNATNFDVRVKDFAANYDTANVVANHTDKYWRACSGTMTIDGDGTRTTPTVEARAGAASTLWIAGLVVFG